MALTVGEIYQRTRDFLDVGSDELPDTLLALFLQEGYDRVISRKADWKHFQEDETVNTVASTRDYTLSTVTDVRQVLNTDDAFGGALSYISSEAGEAIYQGARDQANWPRFWSFWDGSLELWPKPDRVYVLKVRGYRDPIDFIAVGVGAEPDLPDRFHVPLYYWVLSRAYLQQEDPEAAAVWQQAFEEAVAVHLTAVSRPNRASPLALNAGGPTRGGSYTEQVTDLAWAN